MKNAKNIKSEHSIYYEDEIVQNIISEYGEDECRFGIKLPGGSMFYLRDSQTNSKQLIYAEILLSSSDSRIISQIIKNDKLLEEIADAKILAQGIKFYKRPTF